jgi:hypothetical protein
VTKEGLKRKMEERETERQQQRKQKPLPRADFFLGLLLPKKITKQNINIFLVVI